MKISVVGAGIAGLSTAWALAKQGHSVILFEQGTIPNPMGASGDHHRIIRRAYGAGSGYGAAITEAYEAWDKVWADLGQSCLDPRGFMAVSREPGDEAEDYLNGLREGGWPCDVLQPGEAAFLGAGIIHAHLHGMCIEVMTSSDNVLRAGLTSKHVDPDGLVACLERGMSRLARITPEVVGTETEVFAPDVDEFALAVTQVAASGAAGTPLYGAGRRIVLCTGGRVELVARGGRTALVRGESLYVDDRDGDVRVIGTGEVAVAFTPDQETPGRLIDLV